MTEHNERLANSISEEVILRSNGDNIDVVDKFLKVISDAAGADEPGIEVKISIGNTTFIAYDHAALMQGLYDAVDYYRREIQ